jgi:acyl carrier protein
LLNSDPLREKGIIDSTGVLELIAFIETNFHIKIEDLEIIPENLDSIQQITKFVEAKSEGRSVEHLELEYLEDVVQL